jgi:protein ImuB
MTVAQARALLPEGGAVVEAQRPNRERAQLRALARWAMRFSPIVAIDPPDGLLLNIAGCQRLFGGEERLVGVIAAAMAGMGFDARVAAAPSFAAARAVARFGGARCAVVAGGAVRRALGGLPVEALLDPGAVAGLREVGVERVGQLLDLPRASIAARFERAVLARVDEALGRAPEVIHPIRYRSPATVERAFDGPATQIEAIESSVRGLLSDLAALLEERGCGAREVVLEIERLGAGPAALAIVLGRPVRDEKHLWSLLRVKLEGVNLGFGAERLRLTATRLARLPHRQMEMQAPGSCPAAEAPGAFPEAVIDVLSNRLGPQRVLRAERIESHLPERAYRMRPAQESDEATNQRSDEGGRADRPTLLLDRPEPIAVMAMAPEGAPSWFRWRGQEQRVTVAAGPERIAGEWWGRRSDGATKRRSDGGKKKFGESYARAYEQFWRGEGSREAADQTAKKKNPGFFSSGPSSGATRDYYKVQDELGRWLWIYRGRERGGWYVHGVWA